MNSVEVVLGSAAASPTLSLKPGVNLTTGETHLSKHFGPLSSLEVDLVTLASAAYCADLGIKRGVREAIQRSIRLTVPVTNLGAFRSQVDSIRYALYRLSHDAWDINFKQRPGTPEAPQGGPDERVDRVLLFSGGLDSFAGAVQFGEASGSTALVSHVTANRVVSGAQEQLARYLQREYPGRFERYAVRVGASNRFAKGFPFPTDQHREETQRTRSFLFLAIAAVVARRIGAKHIVVIAENGQMAIHLPLSAARIGAFSTQTAHPEFLAAASTLLSNRLQYDINIQNPFLYATKAQAVAQALRDHRRAVSQTVSCWKASRVTGATRHCGFCIPCLVRRIAVEANGPELKEYERDILREDLAATGHDDDGKRNLIELGELIRTFAADQTQAQFERAYPDLINGHFDAVQAVAMYQRFAKEAMTVLKRYPLAHQLLA